MKKIIFLSTIYYLLSTILLSTILMGCVPILIGTGVVTGYLTTKDSVSGNIEASFDELWNTSLKVAASKAQIIKKDKDSGLIKAKRGKDEIVVKIKELTEHSYNLKVTCRKARVLANIKLAQKIFTKIVRNLAK